MYDVCTARYSDVYSWFSRQCLSKALWFPFKEQTLRDWDFSLKAQSTTSCSDSALPLFPPFLIFLPPLILPLSAFIYLTTPSKKITCSYNSASYSSSPSMSCPLWRTRTVTFLHLQLCVFFTQAIVFFVMNSRCTVVIVCQQNLSESS